MSEPCQLLPFDSELFGCRVASLAGPDALAHAEVGVADCFYVTVSLSDREAIEALTARRAFLADVKMTLEGSPAAASVPPDVGPVQEGDVDALAAIARTAHHDSRFFFDPRFAGERASRLFDIWIRRSVEGWAQRVLVPRRDGAPAGYITCHVDSSDAGRIGLVAIAESARGHGLGSSMLVAALDWFARQNVRTVSVVTQARNVAAQRLYQQHGFRTRQVSLVYHLWV